MVIAANTETKERFAMVQRYISYIPWLPWHDIHFHVDFFFF